MRKSLAMLIAAALALVVSSCGSSGTTTSTTSTSAAASSTASTTANGAGEISTRTLPGLGAVLVNGQGRTLYVFGPDKAKKVTCVGACASIWPPLALSGSQKSAVAGQAKASLAGSDPNPSGGRVATYAGWPLYTYVTDVGSGTAKGQALNLNGGVWYVISASGTVVHKKPSTGGRGY